MLVYTHVTNSEWCTIPDWLPKDQPRNHIIHVIYTYIDQSLPSKNLTALITGNGGYIYHKYKLYVHVHVLHVPCCR
jgi:hypothetical protein